MAIGCQVPRVNLGERYRNTPGTCGETVYHCSKCGATGCKNPECPNCKFNHVGSCFCGNQNTQKVY